MRLNLNTGFNHVRFLQACFLNCPFFFPLLEGSELTGRKGFILCYCDLMNGSGIRVWNVCRALSKNSLVPPPHLSPQEKEKKMEKSWRKRTLNATAWGDFNVAVNSDPDYRECPRKLFDFLFYSFFHSFIFLLSLPLDSKLSLSKYSCLTVPTFYFFILQIYFLFIYFSFVSPTGLNFHCPNLHLFSL